MEHQFAFEFDLAFVRAALRRDFVWRGAVVVATVLAIAFMKWLVPDVSTFVSGLSTLVILLGIASVVRLYLVFRSSSQRVYELWCKQSPSRTIRYRLDEQGFEITMDEGTARYEWQGLRRLWRYPDVWIIEVVKKLSVFFPPGVVPEDAREFVIEHCGAAGVRVKP